MIARAKKWIIGHQWPVFIAAALVLALALTGVSLWLYKVSGAAKLDLSRPGYEKVREDVKDYDEGTKPFSPTGNLDAAAIADFRARYEKIKARLDQMNSYDDAVLSDENLGLATGQAVTEPIE
ncbi:hypothetical protein FWD20_02700 [Candidatus Saccharibacteria bacterium]|nr:hypothetical protein [Candidatus Saccharibacteria bacterium]